MFFNEANRSFLKTLRVKSKSKLKEQTLQYIDEVNQMPIILKWKYKIGQINVCHIDLLI